MHSEPINAIPWLSAKRPKKILAIRLQALGDVIITLPYLQSLKESIPDAEIDFLTRKEVDDIPNHLDLFTKVFSITGGRNFKLQFLHALVLLPKLWIQRYDVVIDLQKNPLSQFVRKALNPESWSEFDRFSPISAGERTRQTISALGIGDVRIAKLKIKNKVDFSSKLIDAGWQEGNEVVVLNPAGYFKTRNWPIENYVEFAKIWLAEKEKNTKFLVLGNDSISQRVSYLKEKLGQNLINLVNQTSQSEAFAIIQKTKFVLSEDSGLMHMAWVVGIPTLALFGSSRSDWSAPLGECSISLNSSDLPCGECMQATCRLNDIRCLTRFTPQMVFEKAVSLLE